MNLYSFNHNGRRKIYTDYREVTDDNVVEILVDAFTQHMENYRDCEYLLNYDAGIQPITREKKYRPDIDSKVVDNVANQIVSFWTSFFWGNPITFAQRGEEDTGSKGETKSIACLNELYGAIHINSKRQELARYVEICGIGYELVDICKDYVDGENAPFTIDVLDPRTTFKVRSTAFTDHRAILDVTYYRDRSGNRHFTCFSDNDVYFIDNLTEIVEERGKKAEKVVWRNNEQKSYRNPLGKLPIVEFIKDHDRMGVFERQISELDNVNLLVSDFTNQVDQNTQCVWFGVNIEFPKDDNGNVIKPKDGEWVLASSTPQGNPAVQGLAVNYDYKGMLENIIERRDMILTKCNVPQRKTSSSGASGVAMSDASGWTQAEAVATKQQGIIEESLMQEVAIVLRAIKKSSAKIKGINKLRACDVQPNMKRQKTYEMTTKVNALATMIAHGVHGFHAIKQINYFDDPNQVWEDSKELIEQFQKKAFGEQENQQVVDGGFQRVGNYKPDEGKLNQDQSDQEGNSPVIGGNTVEDKNNKEEKQAKV